MVTPKSLKLETEKDLQVRVLPPDQSSPGFFDSLLDHVDRSKVKVTRRIRVPFVIKPL